MKFQNIKRTGIVIICLLALMQCIARIAIPMWMAVGSGPGFEESQPVLIEILVPAMFLVIGTVGLYTTYALFKGLRWGYLGTIYLSIVTIVFDVWAFIEIQSSAAMGIVLPAVFIVFLVLVRNDYSVEVKSNEGIGRIWN